MTLDEFFSALRRTGNEWWVTPCGAIRCGTDKGYQCPITAVCFSKKYRTYPVKDVEDAGGALGLLLDVIKVIVDSADNFGYGFDPAIRARLLAAVGIKEGWTG